MGYAYSVYGVDLAKVRRVWKSEDGQLFVTLKKKFAEHMVDNDQCFEEELAGGAPPLIIAIQHIIWGMPMRKHHGFQYGYALELLCKHFGGRIDKASLTWFDELLDPLLKKANQPSIGKLLARGKAPISIPRVADFPELGTLERGQQTALAKALDAIAKPEDDDTPRVIAELRRWLAAAKTKKLAIVWFVY